MTVSACSETNWGAGFFYHPQTRGPNWVTKGSVLPVTHMWHGQTWYLRCGHPTISDGIPEKTGTEIPTIWLFNIAMENGPFIEVHILKIVIFHGYVSHSQMVLLEGWSSPLMGKSMMFRHVENIMATWFQRLEKEASDHRTKANASHHLVPTNASHLCLSNLCTNGK